MNLKEAEDRIRHLESQLSELRSTIDNLTIGRTTYADSSRVSTYSTSSISASYADRARVAAIATSSLYSNFANNSFSSSYALTASYALNGGGSGSGPSVSSSYADTASLAYTASYFSGQIVSASYAITASYVVGQQSVSTFPYTGSAIVSGSLILTGSFLSEDLSVHDPYRQFMIELGSDLKAETFPLIISQTGQQISLTDGSLYLSAFRLWRTTLLTGAKFVQAIQGNYVGDNYNGIGLYSTDGSTLTRITTSSNDADIWKSSANAVVSKSFEQSYLASPGIYYVGYNYNQSSQTTAPQIVRLWNNLGTRDFALGIATGLKGTYGLYITSQTEFPSTIALSTTNHSAGIPWFGIY